MILQLFSSSFIRRICLSLLLLLCVSCGSGDNNANNPISVSPSSGTNISGYVVKGPVAGSVVRLYTVSGLGTKQLLSSATTNSEGFFSFTASPAINSVILLEAIGGTYQDEISNKVVPLGTPLRSVGNWVGVPIQVSLTVFSEVAVRILEKTTAPDWSSTSIANANAKIAAYIGVTSLLDFKPLNLRQPITSANPRPDDIALSFFSGGFAGFANQVDANESTMIATGIDGLYRLIVIDEHDDKLLPAYINGMVVFVDNTSLSDDKKKALKTNFLLANGNTLPLIKSAIDQFVPKGISSGGTTANMPNDGFQMIGNSVPGTFFNARGALIGYPASDASGKWNVLYSASVAEVFGDGEVGIGRWNGGAIGKANRVGTDFGPLTEVNLIQYESFHYAVAKPATKLPTCGIQTLQLLSTTKPTLGTDYVGATLIASKLTSDSKIALQYLGQTYIGVDIGVYAPDGSVTRYSTSGGVAAPWLSGHTLSSMTATGIVIGPVTTGTVLANYGLTLQGLQAGVGGNKIAAKLVFGSNSNNLAVMAAIFNSSSTDVNSATCSIVGNPGITINPAPVDGSFFVFAGVDNESTLGAPWPTNFRVRGELSAGASLQIASTAQIYDLAGNADAMIGRVNGAFVIGGKDFNRSMPYAVARDGAIVPASGSRHYSLVSATPSVASLFGASGSNQPQGQVTTASLEINFGEYPLGTPSPYYGTALLNVTGMIGGVPFGVYKPGLDTSAPSETRFARDGGSFGPEGQFVGAMAAPFGEYVVVRYTAVAGFIPVIGTLLFRAQ